MRRNCTQIVCASLLTVFSFMFLSCADVYDIHEINAPSQPGTVKVGFYAGGPQTRTQMLQNGLSTEWVAGDQIALWALNSSGSYTLSNQVFEAYGLNQSRGFFTSTLPSPMPEDTYTYYCCYPVPASADGMQLTFAIPSEQDGKASAGADVMMANPVQYGPLTAVPDPDDHSTMRMEMNRMMHQFRFYVPENDQILGDGRLKSIHLSFPTAVTGNVTFDMNDLAARPQIAEGQTDVTLNLAQPIGVSKGDAYEFACFAFAPVQFSEGQSLVITKAYTEDKIALFDPIDLKSKNCLSGQSTPVQLKIRELIDYPFKIMFTVAANNLGEGINTIRFTAPEGSDWKGNGSNVFEYTPGHKINAGEVIAFYFDYHQEDLYRAFSGQNISVTYDSDHAIVYETVNVGDAVGADAVNISLTVPYLFYENFSGLAAYNGGYKNGPYTSTSGASEAGIDLSQYGIAGWTGARTGCDAEGVAVAVSGRVDWVSLAATRAYGRLDSPAMTSLKPGANVNLELTFNYSGSKDGASKYSHAAVVGTTTAAGLLNGYATQFSNDKSWAGITAPVEIANIPTNGSAAAANLSMTSTFDDCTSATRLTWHVVAMGKGGLFDANNANTWLYVDNVRVKIAN